MEYNTQWSTIHDTMEYNTQQWDRGIRHRNEHGNGCFVFFECCLVSGSCEEMVTRS
jgi:hypothetical protein